MIICVGFKVLAVWLWGTLMTRVTNLVIEAHYPGLDVEMNGMRGGHGLAWEKPTHTHTHTHTMSYHVNRTTTGRGLPLKKKKGASSYSGTTTWNILVGFWEGIGLGDGSEGVAGTDTIVFGQDMEKENEGVRVKSTSTFKHTLLWPQSGSVVVEARRSTLKCWEVASSSAEGTPHILESWQKQWAGMKIPIVILFQSCHKNKLRIKKINNYLAITFFHPGR